MDSQTETRALRVKRLIYRASYTGMKETDLLLGQFARRFLETLDERQLDEFEALLDAGDPNILDWVKGEGRPPETLDGRVLELIKKFNKDISF